MFVCHSTVFGFFRFHLTDRLCCCVCLQSNLALLGDYLSLYAVRYETPAFFVLWALGTASCAALITSQLLKRRTALKVRRRLLYGVYITHMCARRPH